MRSPLSQRSSHTREAFFSSLTERHLSSLVKGGSREGERAVCICVRERESTWQSVLLRRDAIERTAQLQRAVRRGQPSCRGSECAAPQQGQALQELSRAQLSLGHNSDDHVLAALEADAVLGRAPEPLLQQVALPQSQALCRGSCEGLRCCSAGGGRRGGGGGAAERARISCSAQARHGGSAAEDGGLSR